MFICILSCLIVTTALNVEKCQGTNLMWKEHNNYIPIINDCPVNMIYSYYSKVIFTACWSIIRPAFHVNDLSVKLNYTSLGRCNHRLYNSIVPFHTSDLSHDESLTWKAGHNYAAENISGSILLYFFLEIKRPTRPLSLITICKCCQFQGPLLILVSTGSVNVTLHSILKLC